MRALKPAIAFAAIGLPGAALAHTTGAPHLEPPGWTWDPWITVPLLLALGLFGTGWARLSARSVRGASRLRRRALLFGIGWALLAAALVSPLHQAGERSFAAHMFEHELMMLAAAPLLVLSEPLSIMLWAFPLPGRKALGGLVRTAPVSGGWRAATEPVAATLVQAAALWLWHAPALFDLALASEGWHAAQHLSFLVSALLFWSAMLHVRAGADARTGKAVAVICLFATAVVSGALGALMAFAESPWYVGYARLGMAPFGLTPAEDQQVAGLLMWVPGGFVHAAAALALLGSALQDGSRIESARHAR